MFGVPHPYLEDGQFVPLPGCSGTVKQDCEGFLLFFVQTLLCRVSVGGFQLWLLWENGRLIPVLSQTRTFSSLCSHCLL